MQRRFGIPEEVRDVQHVTGQVNIDATLEQPAQDPDHLLALQSQLPGERQFARDIPGLIHRMRHTLLEERQLRALRDGVRHGQFDHMVRARVQGDHVVEDARSSLLPLLLLLLLR